MSSLYAWRERTRRGDIRACGAHPRTSNTDTKLLIYGAISKGPSFGTGRDALLAHLQKLIEERGEAMVLFNYDDFPRLER